MVAVVQRLSSGAPPILLLLPLLLLPLSCLPRPSGGLTQQQGHSPSHHPLFQSSLLLPLPLRPNCHWGLASRHARTKPSPVADAYVALAALVGNVDAALLPATRGGGGGGGGGRVAWQNQEEIQNEVAWNNDDSYYDGVPSASASSSASASTSASVPAGEAQPASNFGRGARAASSSASSLLGEPASHSRQRTRAPGRTLAEAVNKTAVDEAGQVLDSLALPPVTETDSTPPALIILAPNRTRRIDPLNGFTVYQGGWDFSNKDYWASLAWTTVSGAIIGIAWTLFGLGIVVSILGVCLCCPSRWHRLRDKRPRYAKKDLLWPCLFMVFGVLLELVGFGLMVSGGVKLNNSVHAMTQFTVDQVNSVTGIILQLTPILRQVGQSEPLFNTSTAVEVRSQLLTIADQAESLALDAQSKVSEGSDMVNHALQVLQEILFIFGCIIFGAVLVGLVFSLFRLVVLSNIMTNIIWILCLLTWVMVTVFLFVWLFGGDTTVSLSQISYSPTDLTKFNIIVPCMNPDTLSALAGFARFSADAAISVVNKTITDQAPAIFSLLHSPNGICDPFGPAPDYAYDNSTCSGVCSPYAEVCNGSSTTLSFLLQRLPNLKCNSTNSTLCVAEGDLLALVEGITRVASKMLDAVTALLPKLAEILRCAYISYIATNLSQYVADMEYATLLLWMGFLFVSVGAIFYAACAPIYVYRAKRCFRGNAGEQPEEVESMAGAYDRQLNGEASLGHEQAYPEQEQQQQQQGMEQYDREGAYMDSSLPQPMPPQYDQQGQFIASSTKTPYAHY